MLAPIRDAVATLGFRDGLAYLVSRAMSRCSGGRATLFRYRFYAQPVPERALAPARASRIRVERLPHDDPAYARMPRPAAVIQRRRAQGAHCFAAVREDGEPIGFIWISERQYQEDEVRCLYRWTPTSSAVWDYDVYVAPEARGGRVFARLWDATNAWMRERGIAWSLSRISAFNVASRAAHEKLSIRCIGEATFIVLGNLQVSFASGLGRPHVAWRAGSGPTLVLVPPDTADRF